MEIRFVVGVDDDDDDDSRPFEGVALVCCLAFAEESGSLDGIYFLSLISSCCYL